MNRKDPQTPVRRQRFSLYHGAGNDETLRAWMAPYANELLGCRKVLDVGCGPGAFLSLLAERSIPALGIDFDPDMVVQCLERGFEAQVANATTLEGYREAFDGIHAGHIIEHMTGEVMVRFLETCFEALEPGGRLIVRTPNWENEAVRNGGFWLDHTHVRPYPLPLLERILEDLGYVLLKAGAEPTGWNDLFVVAAKPGGDQDPSAARRGVAFFYRPDWQAEHWKDVVASYAAAFGPDEGVSLALWLDPTQGLSNDAAAALIGDEFARRGLDLEHSPDLLLITDALDAQGLDRLMRTCDWVIDADPPQGVRRLPDTERGTWRRALDDLL